MANSACAATTTSTWTHQGGHGPDFEAGPRLASASEPSLRPASLHRPCWQTCIKKPRKPDRPLATPFCLAPNPPFGTVDNPRRRVVRDGKLNDQSEWTGKHSRTGARWIKANAQCHALIASGDPSASPPVDEAHHRMWLHPSVSCRSFPGMDVAEVRDAPDWKRNGLQTDGIPKNRKAPFNA